MKKSMTVLFVLIAVNLLSQTNDTIILNTGEIISCQIHDISKSGLVTYYYINSDGDSAMAQKVTESIKEIKYGSGFTTKSESGILVKQTQDRSIQKKSPRKPRLYNTWIRTMDKNRMKNIYIYEINKEDITVVSKYVYEEHKSMREANLSHIAVGDIDVISFRKKGAIGQGAYIAGVLAFIPGFIVGILLAFGDYSGDEMWMGILIGGAATTTIGLAIGSVLGSIKKWRFPINGNQEYFDQVRQKLEKRSIKYYYN
jgi:hypothetical protein